ncbi:CPBP family intramembrane glutamic endopeptidase [Auraticoccus monumenti]|uniref:CAAX protease self-immunity n=1 Tax=Auraticoccus monumenti TaxID=675864 RepID=A0A1G6SZY8_9ACTN|nr:CPBP family intramembrane glutamic endopeptidase [Auraticoccus monumenti]SDD22333.1 CAAX protease self-immunity [Auraticoccus monumenti]
MNQPQALPVASPTFADAPTPPPDVAFHRLGVVAGSRGWRPLLVLLLAAVLYAASGLLLVTAAVAVDAITGSTVSDRVLALDMNDPYAFVSGFALIALMLPALLLARRILGPRPVGLLSSVTGRLRWRWLGRALLISVAVYVVGLTLQLVLLDPLTGVPLTAARFIPSAWVFLLGAVLLVPLQAAAEEYVFRGGLMQLVGGWLRHPAFAVVLPVPLFVVGHGYDVLGQTGIAVFALLTGWLTWRTGGLEAAIALHVVNNGLLTVMQAVGWADPNVTDITVPAFVASLVVQGLAAWLLVRSADRMGVQRTRPALAPLPAPRPAPAPVALETSS